MRPMLVFLCLSCLYVSPFSLPPPLSLVLSFDVILSITLAATIVHCIAISRFMCLYLVSLHVLDIIAVVIDVCQFDVVM